MNWQDWVIAVIQIVLAASIVPMIVSWTTPPYRTSVPTMVGLDVLGLVFLSLGLYLSAVTAIVSGLLWTVCVIQRSLIVKS